MEQIPIRDRVEVLITKDDRVCVAWWRGIKTPNNICFPGGGVEEGDTHEKTVIKECLEEVGIQVKDITYLNIREKGTTVFSNVEGGLEKFGAETFIYTAKFDSINMKLFNVEGDGMEYEWLTINKAIEMMSLSTEYKELRLRALASLDKYLNIPSVSLLHKW